MTERFLRRACLLAGTIVLIATIVVTRNNLVLCAVAAMIPWLAVALIGGPARTAALHGWPRLDTESFTYAILLPTLALGAAAMRVALLDPEKVLLPVLAVIGLLGLLAAGLKRLRSARRRFTWTLMALPFYSYACVVLTDSMFDASEVRSYQVRILERTRPFAGARGVTTLAPWHAGQQPRKIRAGLPTWLKAGDAACVDERAGALGIEWFEVRVCDVPATLRTQPPTATVWITLSFSNTTTKLG
jgi:hypothetical protein